MPMFHVTRSRLGQSIGHAKTIIGSIDRGIRTARRIYQAVQPHVPDSKFKSLADKASKGVSDYESIRKKIRNAAGPL